MKARTTAMNTLKQINRAGLTDHAWYTTRVRQPSVSCRSMASCRICSVWAVTYCELSTIVSCAPVPSGSGVR